MGEFDTGLLAQSLCLNQSIKKRNCGVSPNDGFLRCAEQLRDADLMEERILCYHVWTSFKASERQMSRAEDQKLSHQYSLRATSTFSRGSIQNPELPV